MIQEGYDPVIDFSWYYFIGKTKLNMSFKETGRMTLTLFNKFYKHWKEHWSAEMRLTHSNKTFDEAFAESQREQEWF